MSKKRAVPQSKKLTKTITSNIIRHNTVTKLSYNIYKRQQIKIKRAGSASWAISGTSTLRLASASFSNHSTPPWTVLYRLFHTFQSEGCLYLCTWVPGGRCRAAWSRSDRRKSASGKSMSPTCGAPSSTASRDKHKQNSHCTPNDQRASLHDRGPVGPTEPTLSISSSRGLLVCLYGGRNENW